MKPDALSCQIDHQAGEEDNQDQIMLLADHFHLMPKLSAETPDQGCKTNESNVENGDCFSRVSIEREWSSVLERVHNCAYLGYTII